MVVATVYFVVGMVAVMVRNPLSAAAFLKSSRRGRKPRHTLPEKKNTQPQCRKRETSNHGIREARFILL